MELPKQENLAPFKEGVIGEKKVEGTFSSVHEMNNPDGSSSGQVIKVGKAMEKFIPPLLKKTLRIGFPREKLNTILVRLLGEQFRIYPDKDFIMKGVLEHLLIKKYFGHNNKENENELNQEDREEILESLENPNSQLYKDVALTVGNDLMNEVVESFSDYKEYNFLPAEQTVMGYPPNLSQEKIRELRSKGKKLPIVHYIIQEEISGPEVSHLADIKEGELVNYPEMLKKLIVFLLLIKKMYSDTGKLIDTRPEEMAKHPIEWFQATDNILVDKEKDDVSFVDTRLLWDKKSLIGEKGINLIEHLGIRSINRALKKYVGMLNSSKR